MLCSFEYQDGLLLHGLTKIRYIRSKVIWRVAPLASLVCLNFYWCGMGAFAGMGF